MLEALAMLVMTLALVDVVGLIRLRRSSEQFNWGWWTALAAMVALPLALIGTVGQAFQFLLPNPWSAIGVLLFSSAIVFVSCTAGVVIALLLEQVHRRRKP